MKGHLESSEVMKRLKLLNKRESIINKEVFMPWLSIDNNGNVEVRCLLRKTVFEILV